MHKHLRCRAFTLIEMSIVLIIIALIVGSVIVGKNLLRSSNVMASAVDAQRYITAAQQFQQRYNGLPGDYVNIYAFTQPSSAATCDAITVNTGNQTCAGNGDGIIESHGTTYYLPNGSTATTTEAEELLFWQHLAIAGFIRGTYTGVGYTPYDRHAAGINCPSTRVGGCYGVSYLGTLTGNSNYFDASYNHIIYMGIASSGSFPTYSVISSSEALAIDEKFDDGLPASGKIFTAKNGGNWSYPYGQSGSACATTAVSATAHYSTATGNICALGFITGF